MSIEFFNLIAVHHILPFHATGRLLHSMHKNLLLLHLDNAATQNALIFRQFQAENNTAVPLPIELTLLGVIFFSLFPELKGVIKEACFEDVADVKMTPWAALWKIPEESFQEYMMASQRRLKKCPLESRGITSKGRTCGLDLK